MKKGGPNFQKLISGSLNRGGWSKFECESAPLGQKIDCVFPVTRARTTKQPAFTLFILEIPHL